MSFCEHDTMIPGTVVVTEFPGGYEAEGTCARCGTREGVGAVVVSHADPHPGLTPVERLLAIGMLSGDVSPLDITLRHRLDDREVHCLITGWDVRGWIEYGVSLRTGWLTDEGRAALSAMVARYTWSR